MSKGKYQSKREPVVNVAMTAALIMFWLVIITTYMSAGLFAKYSTGDTAGDSARVIKFHELTVEENGVENSAGGKFIFIPGVPLEKDITVKFGSRDAEGVKFGGSEAVSVVFVTLDVIGWDAFEKDVDGVDGVDGFYDFAMNYKAKVAEQPKEIMRWSVDEAWTYLTTETLTPKGNRYVYYMVVAPNDAIEQKVIKDGQITVSDEGYRVDYAGMTEDKVDLQLNATAYVVQANGFENVGDAWTSLSAKEGT